MIALIIFILIIFLLLYRNTERFDSIPAPVSYKLLDGPLVRFDRLAEQAWSTRHPGLVKQRYSYDDWPTAKTKSMQDAAYLDQLVIMYKPFYDLSDSSATCQNAYRCSQIRPISGYNPSLEHPGEYADRSKTSIEKKAGSWLHHGRIPHHYHI